MASYTNFRRLRMAIWVVRQTLISVGIISILLILKPSPSSWLWLKSWLSPLYVYIIINIILILILILVASSSSSSSSSFNEYHHYVPDKLMVDPSSEAWSEILCLSDLNDEALPTISTVKETRQESIKAVVPEWEDENEAPDAKPAEPREMRKWNTFVEGRPSLRRTPYLRSHELPSHDELKQQVEAFIRKCKNEMRLERVESDDG